MPSQPAAHLRGYLVQLDGEAKQAFLAACREYGISGNQAVQRFVDAVIAARKAGRDWTMVDLEGDGSRVPDAPLPADKRKKTRR